MTHTPEDNSSSFSNGEASPSLESSNLSHQQGASAAHNASNNGNVTIRINVPAGQQQQRRVRIANQETSAATIPNAGSATTVRRRHVSAAAPNNTISSENPPLESINAPTLGDAPNFSGFTRTVASQANGGRFTIHVNGAPGSRVQQMRAQSLPGVAGAPAGHGRVRTPMMTARNPGSVTVPPPLVAQIVEFKSPNQLATERDDESSKWKCAICWDVLQDPAGCGNDCSVRFCRKCLEGALQSSRARGGNDASRCPFCRREMSAIQLDAELQESLMAITVECPYGCNLEKIKLCDWKRHEQECPRVKLRCAYKDWGCSWEGPRLQYKVHACPSANLHTLIDRVRQNHVAQQQSVAQIQNGLHTTLHRMHHVAEAASVLQRYKSENNVIDILELAYVSTCLPIRFRLFKDTIWKRLSSSPQARASVYNFLSLFPTVCQSVKIVGSGFRYLLVLQQSPPKTDILESIVDICLAFCIGSLCVATVAISWIDRGGASRAPSEWNLVPFSRVLGHERQLPVMQYLAAFAMMTLHASFMVWNGPGSDVVLWLLLVLTSTVLPTLIVTHLECLTRRNDDHVSSPDHAFALGRMASVVLFGLRFSFLVEVGGLLPCLDSLLLCSILLKTVHFLWDHCLYFESSLLDPLLKTTKLQHIMAVVVARVAMMHTLASYEDSNDAIEQLFFSLLAFIRLVLTNEVFYFLVMVGIGVGKELRTGSVTNREHSVVGMMAYGSWLLMLGGILVS